MGPHWPNKRAIIALVERGGSVRTFHVPTADKATVTKIVTENIARESKLHTDESRLYWGADEHFAEHETVKHSADEYVRTKFTWDKEGPRTERVHTNSTEGYFSIFKRGMRGIYQHCGEKHLHRYLHQNPQQGDGGIRFDGSALFARLVLHLEVISRHFENVEIGTFGDG